MTFYVIRPATGPKAISLSFWPATNSLVGDAPRCVVCGGFLGLMPLLPPVRIEVDARGAGWADIAVAGGELLVSEAFAHRYDSTDLIGLGPLFHTVVEEIRSDRKLSEASMPAYFLARIAQSLAAMDDDLSETVRSEKNVCAACRLGGSLRSFRRVILESGTWSGEDVFVARGLPGICIATQRFKSFVEAAGFVGCVFVDARQFSLNFMGT